MVRHHLPDPVEDTVLDRIVAAGRRAPSAGNTRGQRFVIVTSAATRAAIADLAGEPGYVGAGFDPWLSTAPAHIVLCTDPDAYRSRYREDDKRTDADRWPVPYWWVDAGASLMAVLLAAVDEGLTAGFLGAHAVPGLGELLGMPPTVEPVGVVTVGRAAPARRPGSLDRPPPPWDEVVHRDRWGGRR